MTDRNQMAPADTKTTLSPGWLKRDINLAQSRVAALTPFDPAIYLTTDEARLAYLQASLETSSTRFIMDACVVVARSIAMQAEWS